MGDFSEVAPEHSKISFYLDYIPIRLSRYMPIFGTGIPNIMRWQSSFHNEMANQHIPYRSLCICISEPATAYYTAFANYCKFGLFCNACLLHNCSKIGRTLQCTFNNSFLCLFVWLGKNISNCHNTLFISSFIPHIPCSL